MYYTYIIYIYMYIIYIYKYKLNVFIKKIKNGYSFQFFLPERIEKLGTGHVSSDP